MPFPHVVAVAAGSVAEAAMITVGDEIRLVNGVVPRDVIEYQFLVDEAEVTLELDRGGVVFEVGLKKMAGEPLGIEVSSAVFDRVRTCDNHCEFCFIYQLPKHLRKSLYVKDDDYRLSFLYGNFTTLTRFTELDLERVITERLSPLYVSIHATDPDVRAKMLRNRRGAMSLRWLSELLANGIEVHGQIVVCPGVNDASVLVDTLCGVLERFSGLSTLAAVPLGVSRFSREQAMRPHSLSEARAVLDTIEDFQERFLSLLGRRLVYAADEYYLLAQRDFPDASSYSGFSQHENGIGMAAAFAASFNGAGPLLRGHRGGFFASVDGAPRSGYRAVRYEGARSTRRGDRPVSVLTSTYGAKVLAPLISRRYPEVELLAVQNDYFGGNVAVTGLLTGSDLSAALVGRDPRRRYLLPDVCLSEGRFLDGLRLEDLPVEVEVLETNGAALRSALEAPTRRRIPLEVGA